jgi:putative ABC transport system permease protein
VKVVARLRSLLSSLSRGSRLEADVEEELRFHLDQRIGDLIRDGVRPTEARRRTQVESGTIAVLQEECRDALGLRLLDELRGDLRYVVRGLMRNPGYSFAAISILAVGIGLNTGIFTVTNGALFKGFRLVRDNGRILYIYSKINGQYSGVSYPDFEDWRAQTKSLVGLGAVADSKIVMNDDRGVPARYTATRITTNAFRLLGVQPFLGRDFEQSDASPGAAPVAILAYQFWRRKYGEDLSVIGRRLRIDGAPSATVIGVMPDGFSFPQNQDLWIPLVRTADLQPRDARAMWIAFGRMADGVTQSGVQTEFRTIGTRLETAYPRTNQGQVPAVETFPSFFIGSDATLIFGALWGAAGFVLLIACANLANLTLARAMDLSREMSVHIALGASRWRIIRRAFTESLVLAGTGALFGSLLATSMIRAYGLFTAPPAGNWNYGLVNYTVEPRDFAYFLTVIVVAALLFGLPPALHISCLDPGIALRDGGRGMTGGRIQTRLLSSLVIAEVALAAVLLSGAGVMLRSFFRMANADVGARLDGTISMLLHLPKSRYALPSAENSFIQRLKTRLEAIPGVESVATGLMPAGGRPSSIPYEATGTAAQDEQRRPTTATVTVGPDYFKTLGTRVISGRECSNFDGEKTLPVAIVNERFAARQWPGENPLGRRLRFSRAGSEQPWLTVVGLVSNIVYDRSRQEVAPVVYFCSGQAPHEDWILARTSIPARLLENSLRREIASLDQHVVIWLGPYDVPELLASSGPYGSVRNEALVLLVFACIALVLAALGLFTISAYSVGHRIQEFGIRIAVGAAPHDIFWLVLKQGMLHAGVGLTIGLAASLAVNRALQSQLVRISPHDPLALVISCVTLILAALIGGLIPARRAIRIDPLAALRHE